ncbi:ionotropic receptor 93a-like [Procambarus clarkii]|uniref:ionotropic receptor 93a-like n=1 Tax=Procambarus clarkii TaxID=6728 RepID=UPI0037426236
MARESVSSRRPVLVVVVLVMVVVVVIGAPAGANVVPLSQHSGIPMDLLSVAGGAVGAVLEAASQPTCSLILLSDGTASPSTIFKVISLVGMSTWRGCPWGAGVLEARTDGLDPNRTSTFLSQLVLQARRVRLGSWCVWVVVVSLDTTFLAAFAERSLKGRLLAWDTKLLVVTRLPLTQLHALLSSHWTFSMMAAVFLNLEPTFNHLRFGVFTYLPYTSRGAQVVKVASWTAARGLLIQDGLSFFIPKFSNFYGATVNVTALPFAPFWDELKGPGNTTVYTGSDYLMLMAVAGALNFTINVVPTDSWTEVTQRVEERVSFMATVYHNMLPERLQRFDYSWVYEYGSLDFSMAQPGLKQQWQGLYYPLSDVVWVSVLLALLAAPIVLIMIIRTSERRGGVDRTDGSVVVHQLTGMLLGQNLPRRLPTTSSCRILVMVWLVFGLIIGTVYRGNLTAFLMLPKYPPRAETLQQLVTAADRITMPPYGAEFKHFFSKSDSKVFQRLAELINIVPSIEVGLRQAIENKQAHLENRRYQQLRIAETYTRPDGSSKLYIGRESVLPGQAAWPIPHDAPYKAVLDRCLMAVIEAGLYEKWSKDLLIQAQMDSRTRKQQQREQQQTQENEETDSKSTIQSLTIIHLQGAFMLLVLGLAASGLTFAMEILLLCSTRKRYLFCFI